MKPRTTARTRRARTSRGVVAAAVVGAMAATSCAGTQPGAGGADHAGPTTLQRTNSDPEPTKNVPQPVVFYLARDPSRRLSPAGEGAASAAAKAACDGASGSSVEDGTHDVLALAVRHLIEKVLRSKRSTYYVALGSPFVVEGVQLDAMCEPPNWLLHPPGAGGPTLLPVSQRARRELFLYVSTLDGPKADRAQVELGYYGDSTDAARIKLSLKRLATGWIVEHEENLWMSSAWDGESSPQLADGAVAGRISEGP